MRADQSTDAINQAARAFYYQEHFDEWVKFSQGEYLDRNVSKNVQNEAVFVYSVVKMVEDRFITFTWRFP